MSLSPIVFTLNKVALFAFLVTFGLIIYELFHILKKRPSNEMKTVEVPDFHPEDHPTSQTFTPLHIEQKKESIANVPSRPYIVLTIGGLLIIGGLVMAGLFFGRGKTTKKTGYLAPSTTIVKQVASSGIALYDTNWRELKDQEVVALQPNDFIFIGLKSIPGVDISKARIRINKSTWDVFDETAMYNAQANVYYREFFISTESASLHIEGELYDNKSGWLNTTAL